MNYYDKCIPGEGKMGSPILLVGEAPGSTEYIEGRPFVGESGRLLRDCLSRHGIPAEECYITNLCHYRPTNNNFKLLLNEQVLADGLQELYAYIAKYHPTIIVPLGAWPLKYVCKRDGIKKWRGSIITYFLDNSIKCIPTVHPAAILRDGSLYPTFDLDIKRIANDATYPERRLPVRRFIINPRGLELEEWTERLCASEYLGIDIETIKNSSRILCVGFAPSPDVAVCLSTDSESNRRSIGRILADGRSRKIFQFGTFDTLQLIHLNGYRILDSSAELLGRPYFWDTNNAQHYKAPELPRSLEYLTSIYTREPYYKTVGRGTIPDDAKGWSEKVEKQSLYEYNCRDCCCTIEVAVQQMLEIDQENPIWKFSMSTLEVTRHISASGMLQDESRRELLEKAIYLKMNKKQDILNKLMQLGVLVNVRSPKLKDMLYGTLGLPPQYHQKVITTNEDAIVKLIGFCKGKMDEVVKPETKMQWQRKMVICKLILEIRGLRVLISNYIRSIQKNKRPRLAEDGRLHSTYKGCGTETARWAASKYVDGTGFNSQTLPRDPLEIDDETMKLITTVKVNASEFDEDEDDENGEESEEAA